MSLNNRAEAARERVSPEQGPVTPEAIAELGRALGVKDPEGSMLRLAEVMERSTSLFRNSPDFAIPEVRFTQIADGRFPYYVTRQVNRRGVVVVRDVVPAATACRWRDDLMEYLEANGASAGMPGVRDVFWSKAQAQAREHVGVMQTLAALNRLWKPDPAAPADLTKSLTFCDRAFVGKPACSSLLGLTGDRARAIMAGGPGASQRWLCPHLSKAYIDIFEGRWEDWDPFKAGPRMKSANAAMTPARVPAGSLTTPRQPFRPFQGYVSFGHWGENGNVHVVPMMRVATAFMLLRPFMPDVLEAMTNEEMQGRGQWLCGAGEGPELVLTPKWHQPILNALVRLPPLSPGDAVFWHADTIHCEASYLARRDDAMGAIKDMKIGNGSGIGKVIRNGIGNEIGNQGGGAGGGSARADSGTEAFAGIHVSCLPVCEANSTYVRAQREAFRNGLPPPAFTGGGEGRAGRGSSRKEAAFVGRASREELTRGGRRAMGLWRYSKEHRNPALEVHHKVLDISYGW